MQDTDRRTLIAASVALAAGACSAPSSAAPHVRRDLYQCEGCDGAFERNAATLPAFARISNDSEPGEAFDMTGVVYRADGATPAANVVIYAYHTNHAGLYANGTHETEWSLRHGRLRGWVKTDAQGRYGFRSIRPAPYPDRSLPAHVHLTVLEPGRRPYWIDDIVFDADPLVNAAYRAERENRGGNGIVRLARAGDGAWLARRDITLERHPA